MEYLMGTASDQNTINVVNRGAWKSSCNNKGKQCVSHECRGYSMAKVDMTLSLSNDSQLVVCTQYELPSTALMEESVYVCSHSNLRRCMDDGLNLYPGAVWNCICCCTHLVNLTNPRTPELIVATVTRYLGKGSWPKRSYHQAWIFQSRHWNDHTLWPV